MSARRWHAPRWYSVLLTLFGIAVFFALGAWQVRRAHEKEALFAAFDAAPRQAPITLAQALAVKGPALVEVDMRAIGAVPPYAPYSTMGKHAERAGQ